MDEKQNKKNCLKNSNKILKIEIKKKQPEPNLNLKKN